MSHFWAPPSFAGRKQQYHAALHPPITLGTGCDFALPLVPQLVCSRSSWNVLRRTGMGREHLLPWKILAWNVTKGEDPWGNQPHRRERDEGPLDSQRNPISLSGSTQQL